MQKPPNALLTIWEVPVEIKGEPAGRRTFATQSAPSSGSSQPNPVMNFWTLHRLHTFAHACFQPGKIKP